MANRSDGNVASPVDGQPNRLSVDCTVVSNWGDRLDEGDCGGIACTGGSIPVVENSIVTFSSHGAAVHCDATSSATLVCSNLFGNAGGDWTDCIADLEHANGNLSVNPLFCDADPGDFSLAADSPCLPENNDCGVRIGGYDQGCEWATSVELVEAPPVIGLIGNHPNPFNPRTTILFSVDRSRRTRLTVHDLAGRLIAVLADDVFPRGRHEVVWGGRNQHGQTIASGVYLVRVETGALAEMQKMILLK